MTDKIKKIFGMFKKSEKSKNIIRIEKIHEKDFERIFVTSDIHGYYSLFLKLLDKIQLTKKDLLIIMGDSCDRGPQSYELYKKYMELSEQGYNIKHILGNHQEMMLIGIVTEERKPIFPSLKIWV